MGNRELINELYDQIAQWQKEIEELEDKIDKAYWRIDAEKEETSVEEVKNKLKLIFSRD